MMLRDAIQTEMGAPTYLAKGAQAMVGLGRQSRYPLVNQPLILSMSMEILLSDTSQ